MVDGVFVMSLRRCRLFFIKEGEKTHYYSNFSDLVYYQTCLKRIFAILGDPIIWIYAFLWKRSDFLFETNLDAQH